LPKIERKNIPIDACAIFAATATLFIAKTSARRK